MQQANDPDPQIRPDEDAAVREDGQTHDPGRTRFSPDEVDPAAGVTPPTDDTADPAIEEFGDLGMGVAAKE